MIDKNKTDRLARRSRHAAKKLSHEVADGTVSIVDDARDVARQAFEKVKATRVAAKKEPK